MLPEAHFVSLSQTNSSHIEQEVIDLSSTAHLRIPQSRSQWISRSPRQPPQRTCSGLTLPGVSLFSHSINLFIAFGSDGARYTSHSLQFKPQTAMMSSDSFTTAYHSLRHIVFHAKVILGRHLFPLPRTPNIHNTLRGY